MDKGIGIFEADTLIRATLHMDPEELTDEEWIYRVTMAVWIENYRVSLIAKLFSTD